MSDWHTIFSERGAIIAILGGLGGMVRALAIKTSWREGVRVVAIGSATAFGVGEHTPALLEPWLGKIPSLAPWSGAFIVGLLGGALVERLIANLDPPAGGKDE